MNPKQRRELEDALEALPKRERDRLFDEARKQRSDAQKRRRTKSRESVDGERIGGKSRPDPLIDWVLRLLADERKRGSTPTDAPDTPGVGQPAALREGLVVGLTRRWAEVLPDADDAEPVGCRLSADLASRQQSAIAVGDRAVFTAAADPEIVRVLPRRTVLSRPDPRDANTERVVAANIDAAVIVVSVVSPPLHPRLIDRYLVAIEHGGASPIIAVNKADLLAPDALDTELRQLDPYRAAGIPVAVCRADPETGTRDVSALRRLLEGKTCAFVGHSGVGKSSLANALHPDLGLEVGSVRTQDRRGRHTTTASTMHRVPGGIRVIDTPGVRYFGLADITPDELRWMFPEFIAFAPDCRFADCTHDHEPDCAVRAAAESGRIPKVRHETYLRLLEELRTGKPPGEITERIRPPRDG
ncbi:MAG: ribosome small subunit-dependent GTPase A [Phycisphaerales bacterium]|nr:ribosome small subunit-dependent GTPase A [Planctomycetota bacterium]MCH8509421.1 ribosome small subunit-dependent GTPase A [Phycisphaerales bacterium]